MTSPNRIWGCRFCTVVKGTYISIVTVRRNLEKLKKIGLQNVGVVIIID